MQHLLQQQAQHAAGSFRHYRGLASDSPCSTSYAVPINSRTQSRQRPARRDALVMHGGKKDKGARKEGMALEKTLKTARKQLEMELLRAGTPDGNATLMAKLDEVLASLRAHPVMMEEESSSSSSSSDSSEDEGMPMPRRGGGATTMAMPPSPLPFASPSSPTFNAPTASPHPFATTTTSSPTQQMAPPSPSTAAASVAAVMATHFARAPATDTTMTAHAAGAPAAAMASEAVHTAFQTPAADAGLLDGPAELSSAAMQAPSRPPRVMVCTGSKCADRGAAAVLEAVAASAPDSVDVVPCKCLGKCKMGPAVRVRPEGMGRAITHTGVTAEGVQGILDAHFATPQLQVGRAQDGSLLVVCEDDGGVKEVAKMEGSKALVGSVC